MTLKTRITKLEIRRAPEPESTAPQTPMEQYLALLDGPTGPRVAPRQQLKYTPEEAYRRMCEGAAKRGTGPSTKTPQAV